MRTGFIARTIGGDAQEIAPKVPVVIFTAEAQHGSMAATIAIIVPTMEVEKDGVPATNSAVVGTTEAAATGFPVPALLRGSTDSATRATGTIDRAMRIASEATEAMAAITAEAAEGIAATAGTMARIVVGRWRGIPAFAGIGVTPAAARRTRTTAAVMEGRSVASGIASSDEVSSWFGDGEAARRNYTRSGDRIREETGAWTHRRSKLPYLARK
jgi:hypothetical protein